MNSRTFPRRLGVALLACAAATVAPAALQKGGTAYSKRNETKLLAEPKPLATAVGKAAFAEPLKVLEVRGAWLNVKGKAATGWVFQGNLAEEKPSLAPPAGLTSVEANDTTTSAAARPLAPVANGFADRQGAGKARADVEWVEQQAAKVGPAAVNEYLRANKKGEFQE